MSDKDLIQIVAKDINHLRRSWDGTIDDDTLRRDSVILRRLLVDDDLNKAWKASGFISGIYIVAPRVEFFLDSYEASRIEFLIAGGGYYHGLYIALAMDNLGNSPIKLPANINPQEHKFKLKEFVAATSIYVERTRISRQELIQYVANKLGGAHLDFSREKKQARKHQILDRNIDRFKIQVEGYPPLTGKNTVYFELLSIGQLLARSSDIERFLDKAGNYPS